MEYYAKSDIGKKRLKNQDQANVIANAKDQVLAVVCDGMGGHKAGEIASRVAMEHIVTSFRCIPMFIDEQEIKQWLHDTIMECDDIIKKMAQTHEETYGMGTTVAMALIDGDCAYVSHIGDSRVYSYNGRSFKQVTEDHTLVNELLKRGAITKEAALTHAQKNVLTQALGAESQLDPSYYVVDITNRSIMICSDGLYNCVDDKEIHSILKTKEKVIEKVNSLIDLANENGGKDNISAVLVEKELGGTHHE